ncbi:hypothetical protein GKQ38_01360 [Candidatus Nanohaloarchaea archaeon]|nr:hypothetical protein GKQ38_01360 [Candidatus Nanohaloarchaea archaeon]
MRKKQRLLADPGVSTFFQAVMKNSPVELEELCSSIGVQKQRARNWMNELDEEDLITVERTEGRVKISVDEDNIEALNSFAADLQNDFSSELQKWDERLSQAANEMVRMKDVLDDEDAVQEFNDRLNELKDSSEEIDIQALKSLSEVESFLGYSEIAREEMHKFHRKFKVLDRIKGL